MSDIKRVALNTLEPQKVSEKVIKKLFKTVRISVILPESNEDQCPEYHYKDQLAIVKKKIKQNKETNTNGLENGLDPFGDNDDDVRRIALEMEAKYGSGVTGASVPKKKRKGKKDDYADIGMGYDESDSFIDNTDGYDEIIPQNVTTLHGGFYVNSGALVFKTDDEASSNASSSSSSSSETSSSDSDSNNSKGEEKPKAKRKRVLDTSGESDSDTANIEKEKKLKVNPPHTSVQNAIKKQLFSKNKIQVKKFRSHHKKTVKDLLRAKREDLNMTVPDELKTVEDNIEKESSKENKKPMSITSVTDAIECVVKQVVEETNCDKNQTKQSVDIAANTPSISHKVDSPESLSTENDSRQEFRKLTKDEEVKLPDNLSSEISTIVSKLKEAGMNYKGEGKKAFFTKDVNSLLLSLEKKSKSLLNRSSRLKVYEHLSQYVNCTKDTLMRRAKLLELEDGERRLEIIKVKLKDSIDSVMPTLQANYQLESQKVLEKKFSKEGVESEDNKSLKMPRRKFQWSEEAKKLVKDILGIKKRCLTIEGKHKDNLEEQIVQFLKAVVLPLWPEGWMYMNNLTKVYNSMHENSKNSTSSSAKSKDGAIQIKTQKHSHISITPITNGKNVTEKSEVTNVLTVTKINNDVVKDNPVSSIQQLEKNPVLLTTNVSKDIEKSNLDIIPENIPLPAEVPSDLLTQVKKNDVFKPYISEPSISQIQKLISSSESLQNIEKHMKPNEMFKPYADKVTAMDRSIPDKPKVSSFNDKHSHSEKSKQSSHPYNSYHPEKDKHNLHSYQTKEKLLSYGHSDKHSSHSHSDKHNSHSHSEKDKHRGYCEKDKQHSDKQHLHQHSHSEKDKHRGYSEKDKQHAHKQHAHKHNSYSSEKRPEENPVYNHVEKPSSHLETKPMGEKLSEKQQSDLSKFQMFKPYSETPKSHYEDSSKYIRKDDIIVHRSAEIGKLPKTYSKADFASSKFDVSQPKLIISTAEDNGVIVKNVNQINEKILKDEKKDLKPVIPKAVHCQGVSLSDKRKVLESYQRTTSELNPSSYFPIAVSKHSDRATSTPIMSSKSEGDGQQDIQMVMENLRALQKLSCSPVKNNDNSSSSPVSVIAYNKNFSPSKTGSAHSGGSSSKNDVNSKTEFSGGFQDEFQKQFINSLQQMAASTSGNKPAYNNGS